MQLKLSAYYIHNDLLSWFEDYVAHRNQAVIIYNVLSNFLQAIIGVVFKVVFVILFIVFAIVFVYDTVIAIAALRDIVIAANGGTVVAFVVVIVLAVTYFCC